MHLYAVRRIGSKPYRHPLFGTYCLCAWKRNVTPDVVQLPIEVRRRLALHSDATNNIPITRLCRQFAG
jgi:hypothetical protein